MFTVEQELAFAIRTMAAVGVTVESAEEVVAWYTANHRHYRQTRLVVSARTQLVGGQRVTPAEYNRQLDLNAAIDAAGRVRLPSPQETEGYW